MAEYRSMRYPPRRTVRRSSARFLVTVLLTTTMVATGGLGAFPDNPVTQALQEEIGQNFPEPLLNPINSYLNQLSVPTIQPRPDSNPNPPLDLVGFFLDSTTSENPEALNPVIAATATSSVDGIPGTKTPTVTLPSTSSLTATPAVTPTLTFTPTLTPTRTCSRPSTTPVNTTFFNGSAQTIDIYLVDPACNLIRYGTLSSEQFIVQGTYIGQLWWFINSSTGHLVATHVVSSADEVVDVSTGIVAPTDTATPTVALTATTAPFVGFTVSNVDLTDDVNPSGTSITVMPGQAFYVYYNFQVFNDPCPGCITQLVTGLGTPGSHGGSCAYHGIPGVFPGVSGSENYVQLIAPSTPGTFPVVVEYHWQYTCADALTNYGGGGATGSPQVIGQIIVQ